jgi:hypothetical protein
MLPESLGQFDFAPDHRSTRTQSCSAIGPLTSSGSARRGVFPVGSPLPQPTRAVAFRASRARSKTTTPPSASSESVRSSKTRRASPNWTSEARMPKDCA